AMQRAALADDERFKSNRARVTNKHELLPMIETFAAQYTNQTLAALLDSFDIPNAPVQTIEQVIQDPQTLALGILQSGPEGAFPTVGLPLTFDNERPAYRQAAPTLGQHTKDWLDLQ